MDIMKIIIRYKSFDKCVNIITQLVEKKVSSSYLHLYQTNDII